MILRLLNSMVHRDKEIIILNEAYRDHGLTKASNGQGFGIKSQKTRNVQGINLNALIVDDVDIIISAVLVGNCENVASVVLLNKIHLNVVAIIVYFEDLCKLSQGPRLKFKMLISSLHNA